MARHLAMGENFQAGSVYFDKSKSVVIYFDKPFPSAPSVTVIPADDTDMPFYRFQVKEDRFTIKCKKPFTGLLYWEAKQYTFE